MIHTQWETIPVDGNPMALYQAWPETGGPYPAVLVWMEIFGVNDHIQEVTRRVAEAGYVAVALDYYHRVAPGIQLPYTAGAIAEGRQYKNQTTQAHILADATAAIHYIQGMPLVSPKEKLGSIGFCFGGYAAYVAARLPQIAVTASFYGAGIVNNPQGGECPPVMVTDQIKGTILCLFGEKDASIPPSDVNTLQTALEAHHVPHQVLVYPGADHGFFCDQRASYQAEAAQSAWQTMTRTFSEVLQKAPVS